MMETSGDSETVSAHVANLSISTLPFTYAELFDSDVDHAADALDATRTRNLADFSRLTLVAVAHPS